MRRRGWWRRGQAGGGAFDRLAVLESAVERLRDEAEHGTLVVEGVRDLAALARLGIGGRHVVLHQGLSLDAMVEVLAASPPPVVLLLDWDRKGGQLVRRIEEQLRSRVRVDLENRRRLAVACQTRFLEEVPAELEALRGHGLG